MSKQGGQLLVARRHLTLDPGDNDIDTGITAANPTFTPDPGFDGDQAQGIASRVMVRTMFPLDAWMQVSHEEPFVDPDTGTVHVVFRNDGAEAATINVCFDGIHSIRGPVSADPYGSVPVPPSNLIVPMVSTGGGQVGGL